MYRTMSHTASFPHLPLVAQQNTAYSHSVSIEKSCFMTKYCLELPKTEEYNHDTHTVRLQLCVVDVQ